MTSATPISNANRFLTSSSPCPICGGYASMRRGNGERCCGFLSEDREYAVCTREEYAGQLPLVDTSPPGYRHKLHGDCNCGTQHGASHLRILPIANKDARPPVKKDTRVKTPKGTEVAVYDYQDATGQVVYQVVRYANPKYFKQRRPGERPDDKPIWDLTGVTRVLYHLPRLLKADLAQQVYVVEGEKDVKNLERLGLIATTSAQGADGWNDRKYHYSDTLKGRHVVMLPDNDEAGEKYAQQVVASLKGKAASVRVVRLPGLSEKGDVSDWLAAGGTREKLEDLAPPLVRQFLCVADVVPEEVTYLWHERLAAGTFTVLTSDPEMGKSTLISAIIAKLTTGGILPGNKSTIPPGGALIIQIEESSSRAIRPRLQAAGADLRRVFLLGEIPDVTVDGQRFTRLICLPDDASTLEEAITRCRASLVVVDPLDEFISMKFNVYNNRDVRAALAPIQAVAQRTNCALLGILHRPKGQPANPMHCANGSIAFSGVPRIGLTIVPDPDDERGRVLVCYKNNLAQKLEVPNLRFSIETAENGVGRLQWEGVSSRSHAELLNQDSTINTPKSEQESKILAVLEKSGSAMTIGQILPHTNQSRNALEKMLDRKVKQGMLMRPARGQYTLPTNPLFSSPEKAMSTMSTMSVLDQSPLQATLRQTDIVDIVDMGSDANFEDHTAEAPLNQPIEGVHEQNGHAIASTSTNELRADSPRLSKVSVLGNGHASAWQADSQQTDKTDMSVLGNGHNVTAPTLNSINGTRPPKPTQCCALCERKGLRVNYWVWGPGKGDKNVDDHFCAKCLSPWAWSVRERALVETGGGEA